MNLLGVARRGRFQLYACGVAGLFVSAGLAACNLDNPGYSPPEGVLNYPVALALSASAADDARPAFLYVANANFDLRYNSGSIQSYDLQKLAEKLQRCGAISAEQASGQLGGDAGAAGPDAGDDGGEQDAGVEDGAVADAGSLDGGAGDAAFADAELADAELADAELADAGSSPVDGGLEAGAPTTPLTRVTVDGGRSGLQADERRAVLCDGREVEGRPIRPDDESVCCFGSRTSLEELRPGGTSEVRIPSFASGMALQGDFLYVPVRSKSRVIYVGVRGDGTLECEGDGRCNRGPSAGNEAVAGELDYPQQPTAIATGALADLLNSPDEQRGYVATAHDTGEISLFTIGRADQPGERAGEPILQHVLAPLRSRLVSLSADPVAHLLYSASASTSVTSIDRLAALSTSSGGRAELRLQRSSEILLSGVSQDRDVRAVLPDSRDDGTGGRRFYVLARGVPPNSGNSLLFLEAPARTEDGFAVRVAEQVLLGDGVNRLLQATIDGRHFLIASGYTERAVSIVDADRRTIVATVNEFSGPYDMQVDVPRRLLYVADFGASVVRVVNLRGLTDPAEARPSIVGTIGKPYFTGSIQ